MAEVATAAATAAAGPGNRVDPYRAYGFKLEIQGVAEGHFTECSGLDVFVQVLQYREAGVSQVVRQIPGRVEYGAITLRYGVTSSRELWDWFTTVVRGTVERRNISIVLLAADGTTEAMRWNLVAAWPSRWRGVTLDAMSRELAIESLTIVFDTLDRG